MSRAHLGRTAAALFLLPALASAQKRVIALPDTMGANFAIADSARSLGSLHDYDRVLGLWRFTFQPRNDDGTFAEPFTGHWSFEVKSGGNLMIDWWRPDDPSQPMDAALYTVRLFSQVRKVWQMVGAPSQGGEFRPGVSWADARNLYLVQRTGNVIARIRYFAIEKDHFLWRADRSADNGKTWIRDSGVMEATRISSK